MKYEGKRELAGKLDSNSAHPASLFSISVPRDDRKRTGIQSIQPQEPRVGTRQHGSIAWVPPRGERPGYLNRMCY